MADLQRTVYPHSGHPSSEGRAQDSVSSPAKDRRSANCATQPGGLGATYDDFLRLIGKRVADFLLVLIEVFSLGVTAEALRANIGLKSAISLQRGPVDRRRGLAMRILSVRPYVRLSNA